MNEDVLQEIRADVKAIYKILLGNGQVGLCEQTRSNTSEIQSMKSDRKNAPKAWRSWLTFGLTILTALFIILTYIYK